MLGLLTKPEAPDSEHDDRRAELGAQDDAHNAEVAKLEAPEREIAKRLADKQRAAEESVKRFKAEIAALETDLTTARKRRQTFIHQTATDVRARRDEIRTLAPPSLAEHMAALEEKVADADRRRKIGVKGESRATNNESIGRFINAARAAIQALRNLIESTAPAAETAKEVKRILKTVPPVDFQLVPVVPKTQNGN